MTPAPPCSLRCAQQLWPQPLWASAELQSFSRKAEPDLRLLQHTCSRQCKLWAMATAEASFHQEKLEHAMTQELNWDPTTRFSRVQLCNCCHKWTNTRHNNITKTSLFHPHHKNFPVSPPSTNISFFEEDYKPLCTEKIFWLLLRPELSPNRRRDGGLWARTRWGLGSIRVAGASGQGQLCYLTLLLATAALKS